MARTKVFLGTLVVAAAVLATAVPPARAADEVLSGNIREADNKTGQNTNTGAGVKTNHLQNGAVTSAKIKDGNVLTADLALRSVTATKVGFYKRVLIVDVNGGGNFVSPVAAMNAAAAMSPPPSAGAPVLVRIMPGVYDIGQSPVVMRPFVDVEGSGEGMTRIVGAVASAAPGSGAAVVGASDAEIRFLSIANAAAGPYVAGFIAPPGTSPSLLHVTVTASGGATTHGISANGASVKLENVNASSAATLPLLVEDASAGISLANCAETVLSRVSAVATAGYNNYGVSIADCSPRLQDVEATAAGSPYPDYVGYSAGVFVSGVGEPVLKGVTASGEFAGLLVYAAGGTRVHADGCSFGGGQAVEVNSPVWFSASRINGGITRVNNAPLKCVGSYNGSYDWLLPDCSTCTAADGLAYVGVHADAASCETEAAQQGAARCCSRMSQGFQFDPGGLCYVVCR